VNLLAGVLSAALLVGGAAWVPGESGGPEIRLSVVNWGQDADLSTPVQAYAHLGATGAMTQVKVRITPPSSGMHGYVGRLTAPDAFGGELKLYCGDEYRRIDLVIYCRFDVPMSSGINHLRFDLQSPSWEGMVSKEGTVYGGRLGQVSVIEAALPYGNWALVPARSELALRGEQISSLRYRIMNTGDLPFKVPDSCQPGGTVWPYQQLLCTVRGPRPVYALAGEYALPVELADPAGGGASFTLHGILVAKNGPARR
jgi:hypothetical protein